MHHKVNASPACWCVSQGSSWGKLGRGTHAEDTRHAFPNKYGVLSIMPDGALENKQNKIIGE